MATSFVAGLRTSLHQWRAIPGQRGLRPYTVDLVTRGWSGDDTGRGEATELVTPLTHAGGQPPKVEAVNERRVALGIGLDIGDVTVGPVTPVASAPWATLHQDTIASKQQALIRITHTETGEVNDYRIVDVDQKSALGVRLTCKPVSPR